ncbi:hypothetical protein NCG97_21940 [Streptomyces lydicamycinicus]|uniref:GIY-YIG nuclease family protein n=1 Tax=Streptomyces lydicamycinicus TaxID=1546107 RepID=UPI002034EDC4|nr:hypothetical protein [Streptomyces lydicamycinicus]USA02727.1 hypothetical protein NCG97_21940 [Streptomyces lydicamycinicus]
MRRTLAGLVMPTEGYRTTWTDRVVLVQEDEERLTKRIHDHLALTWVEYPHPFAVEGKLISQFGPPLNGHSAGQGAALEAVKEVRARHCGSAAPWYTEHHNDRQLRSNGGQVR